MSIKVDSTHITKENGHFYKSLTTGNKKGVNKNTIKQLKYYGLIHLLTPSGIHLSSIIVFFKSYYVLELLFLIILYTSLQYFNGHMSMERVILFRLIYKGVSVLRKSCATTEMVFILTIIFSFLLGHFQRSSLSLLYSFAFWGTIILYRKNKLKIILYMNFMLYYISSFSGSEHGLLSIIINPLYTAIMSFAFPLLIINTFLPPIDIINQLINIFLTYYIAGLNYIYSIDSLPHLSLSTISLIIFIIFVQFKQLRLAVFIICLFGQSPSPKQKRLRYRSYIRPTPHEVFNSKKHSWHYGDRYKCKLTELDYFCKKKPSKYRGSF